MGYSKDNSRVAKLAAEEALTQAQRAELASDYIEEKQPLIDEFVDEQTNLQTQLNDLVLQSGTDIAEVVQARGGFATVNDRLANTTAQLAVKAGKTEVDAKVAQIVSGSPKGTYATLALLQAAFPTGTTGVYIVATGATAGHWYYWNGSAWTDGGVYQSTGISNNSVTNEMLAGLINARKISGFVSGKNLFNKSAATSGGYIHNNTGNIVNTAGFFYSEYIPFSPSTQGVKKGTYSYAFYDQNKVFISGSANGTTFTSPANCAYIRISSYETINGSTAGVNEEQLEIGTVSTAYEPYMYTLKGATLETELFKKKLDEVSVKPTIQINLPTKIYGVVGKELNIYFDSIIVGDDTSYNFDVVCTIGSHFKNFYRVTPTTAGSYPITIIVYEGDTEVGRVDSTLIISATSVGNGVTKKVLIIGDSTTDNVYLIPKLMLNFSSDVMDIESLGTIGTTPNKHEGHAGWSAAQFISPGSPFVFSGVFNFAQYLSTNAIATPDYVFINLGINDVFSSENDTTLNTNMINFISRYNTMINSIKSANSAIKIGIALTIPPNYSQDAFGFTYGSARTRKRHKRNVFLWVRKLMETYGGRELENLHIIPIHSNLDTRYNFGLSQQQVNARNTKTIDFPTDNPTTPAVHPAESGYWQIADSYWYFLKSFEV